MPIFIRKASLLFAVLAFGLASCHDAEKKEPQEDKAATASTPVTVTTISTGPISESIELNATSAFLQKNYVKANVNGYIEAVSTQPGNYVKAGQTLFTVKTKEAKSIDNSINKLDPSFKFSGVNNIKASASGYITQLNHQVGDYVQDGEQLAVISNENSFAFLLNLPFELRQYVRMNSVLDMSLADDTKLKGTVTAALPSVDPASQTQSIVIKVPNSHLPENLIAKVIVVKTKKTNAISLPKAAILTNDVQNDFWVMKMIDSTTAVKVPVKKGVETNDQVEITDPVFTKGDKIIVTGNYGLPDTAKVKIVQ